MEKIRSIMILEVLGRPADYVKESASSLVDNLGKEKGIKILRRTVADTKQIPDKDMFSTFAEVEVETADILVLVDLMFRYMPAHIEIIEPEKSTLGSAELNDILNNLILKLHRYDELAKILTIEKGILGQQVMHLKQQLGIEEPVKPEKAKSKPKKKSKKK